MAEKAMNLIHITKLDHVVLRVADIEKSIHFYREILGCPEKRISDGLYQYQAGTSMIDLVPIDSDIGQRSGYGPPEAERNVDHFALTLGELSPILKRTALPSNGVDDASVPRDTDHRFIFRTLMAIL
jgi:catechol 2,3-dioxygenase-like lactoylglutathione lyase family enzyme